MQAMNKTVAIVGLGLIGGSFALALREAGFEGEIIGRQFAAGDRSGFARVRSPRGFP